jgi:hypothetical protein
VDLQGGTTRSGNLSRHDQIEARPPDIPGMARIATAVQLVTSLVREATDEDRTLVVHSGDFLPSYMTTKLGFAGKQVVTY